MASFSIIIWLFYLFIIFSNLFHMVSRNGLYVVFSYLLYICMIFFIIGKVLEKSENNVFYVRFFLENVKK